MADDRYCLINKTTNICDNVILWDGNTDTWQPPDNYLVLNQATTPARIWEWNESLNDYELVTVLGKGDLFDTWDGFVLTTEQEKPIGPPPPIPVA